MAHGGFTPRENRFSYRLSMLYLDLDESAAAVRPVLVMVRHGAPPRDGSRRADFLGDAARPLQGLRAETASNPPRAAGRMDRYVC